MLAEEITDLSESWPRWYPVQVSSGRRAVCRHKTDPPAFGRDVWQELPFFLPSYCSRDFKILLHGVRNLFDVWAVLLPLTLLRAFGACADVVLFSLGLSVWVSTVTVEWTATYWTGCTTNRDRCFVFYVTPAVVFPAIDSNRSSPVMHGPGWRARVCVRARKCTKHDQLLGQNSVTHNFMSVCVYL